MRPATERDVLFALYGKPTFLGALSTTAGTVVDNTTTATVFSLASGTVVLLQAGATAGYFSFGAAEDQDNTESVFLQPYERMQVICPTAATNSTTKLSWNPVSGTDVLNVFTLS